MGTRAKFINRQLRTLPIYQELVSHRRSSFLNRSIRFPGKPTTWPYSNLADVSLRAGAPAVRQQNGRRQNRRRRIRGPANPAASESDRRRVRRRRIPMPANPVPCPENRISSKKRAFLIRECSLIRKESPLKIALQSENISL